MNMLPIRTEWKRRMKWAEKQRKEQTLTDKSFAGIKNLAQASKKTNPKRED